MNPPYNETKRPRRKRHPVPNMNNRRPGDSEMIGDSEAFYPSSISSASTDFDSPFTDFQDTTADYHFDSRPSKSRRFRKNSLKDEPLRKYPDDPNLPRIRFNQPGRPGCITLEQEKKLKQMWLISDALFGEFNQNDPSYLRNIWDTINKREKLNNELFLEAIETDLELKYAEHNIFANDNEGKSKADKIKSLLQWRRTPLFEGIEEICAISNDFDQLAYWKRAIDNKRKYPGPLVCKQFWASVKTDHPDNLLLRFLRARNWDVEKAIVMAVATLQWRIETGVEQVLYNGEAAAIEENDYHFLNGLRSGRHFIHGVDREGRLVVYIRAHLHFPDEDAFNAIQRLTVWSMDTGRLLLKAPVDQAVMLFDLSRFSVRNLDYPILRFLIRCFTAYYPDCTSHLILHKAPWMFQGGWQLIKGWLDPVLRSRVHFTRSTEDLLKFISRDQLLKEYGGDNPFEFEYFPPLEDENLVMWDFETRDRLLAEREAMSSELEKLTAMWATAENQEESDRIWLSREALIHEFAEHYWKLDPYIRSRGYYDRIGVIYQDGNIQWGRKF